MASLIERKPAVVGIAAELGGGFDVPAEFPHAMRFKHMMVGGVLHGINGFRAARSSRGRS